MATLAGGWPMVEVGCSDSNLSPVPLCLALFQAFEHPTYER